MRLSSVILSSTLLLLAVPGPAVTNRTRWRPANESELRRIIPARASVLTENIETELRTASGVTDGKDRFIAGVVMITAGYSAEGKYSHFFVTQAPLTVGNVLLQPAAVTPFASVFIGLPMEKRWLTRKVASTARAPGFARC